MTSKELCKEIALCHEDEILHILRNLKRRFSKRSIGTNLVYRVERELKKRFIPKRNKTIEEISRKGRAYANIARDSTAEFYKIASEIHKILNFPSYSEFQFYGWTFVYDTLTSKSGLIISAPTGSGKTETFIPPLILKIIHELEKGNDFMALIIYPRVSLLREQASRIFKYIYEAQKAFDPRKNIVIGLQFAGIAASIDNTLQNRDIFLNKEFLLFKCPVCGDGNLIFSKNRGRHILKCQSCEAEWMVSLSKETHIKETTKPNMLITTFESLDRLFLHPKFEDLFKRIEALFIDEVHLFHGIYGAHISNFIKNIEKFKNDKIAKIGISATIANPKEFGSKLFYKEKNEKNIYVHTADEFEKEESGCEFIYFIKANQQENASLEASTFIQTAMAVGHGVLKKGEQALAFIDSIDLVKRFKGQIKDAEESKQLWSFRVLKDEIEFNNLKCPEKLPCECEIYKSGECWRVIQLKEKCYQETDDFLKRDPLKVEEVSSKSYSENSWEDADLVLSTPSLEVGIDKDTILATIHYRAPKSIFSFIQRRGRAGRKSDKAYTFVVLGNTSMDNFYFYKRHRLLDESKYSLPLNPQNEVVEKMHRQLIRQRNEILERYKEFGERALDVIKDFIITYFQNCALLKEIYITKLEEFKSIDNFDKFIKAFGKWINEEKSKLETYFNIEQIIRFMKEEVSEIDSYADQLLTAIKNNDINKIKELQIEILKKLVKKELELLDELNKEEFKEFQETKRKLQELLENIGNVDLNIRVVENVENYYLFFKTLVEKLEYGKRNWIWKSRSMPDIVKAFFQASFYLHLNIETEQDKNCPFSNVDFYLPDAYFQEVKPIVVEIQRGRYTSEFILEDSSMLEYMLIPYKAIYRYSGDEFINVVDTGQNNLDYIIEEGIGTYKIVIPIRYENIKGIDKGSSFEVSSIKVKSLRTDSEGKQTLKICPECFTLHSFNKRKGCHNLPLQPVRIDAKPISRKEVITETLEETFQFSLEKIQARILIEGSDVKVFETIVNNEGNIIPTTNDKYTLKIRYEKPLSYTLISKGIKWKVKEDILEHLSDIEKEKLLHTGAHLLLKAVANIGGVHEQVLQYHFNVEKGEIYVWERYEGGIGVADTVFKIIKENPIEVYNEFVSTILCPIYYSQVILEEEKEDEIESFLKGLVRDKFYLGEDSEIVTDFIKEVIREIEKMQDNKGKFLCEDGCPICIHINYCQAGFSQQEQVSRRLAEKLVKNLVKEKDLNLLNEEDLKKVLVRNNNKVLLVEM